MKYWDNIYISFCMFALNQLVLFYEVQCMSVKLQIPKTKHIIYIIYVILFYKDYYYYTKSMS